MEPQLVELRLILVRHAAVDVRGDEPAESWRLSAEGRAAAAALGGWAG